MDLSSPGRLERSGGLVAVARSGRAAAASQAAAAATTAPVDLEPERRGKRVVPMLGSKAPTRIDPSQRQASMPAIDIGGDSVDQGMDPPTPRSRRGLHAVPWLPWAVAVVVTAWAVIATLRIIGDDAPTPSVPAPGNITPTDGEREALRERVDELEAQLKVADQAKSTLEARVRELDEAAARDRASIGDLESRLAAAAEQGRTPQARKESDSATDTTAVRDDASTTVADASLKRPQAASGDQRLGEVDGSTITIQWPEGAAAGLACTDGVLSRLASGKRLARLRLDGGAAVWTWDELELSALNGELIESILDSVTAASLMIDGRQAAARIDPRTLMLQVPRKSLVPRSIELRPALRLPWAGPITVRSNGEPMTVEPGRAASVDVSDELGTRGVLTVQLGSRGDRVTFSFTPDASLDQEATRRRLADATEANEVITLVVEHDRLLREQPAKPPKSVGTSKGREAYEAYLARHPLIVEKIGTYRTQGLDDLKEQLARDRAAAAAEVEAATTAVARADALRARWPKAVAEIAPRGGQGFVLVRVEASGP
jgi:hypothetical protein